MAGLRDGREAASLTYAISGDSAKTGHLAIDESSRGLMASGLSVATVKSDDSGNSRLVKSKQNTARDDCPAAWLLVAGAYSAGP